MNSHNSALSTYDPALFPPHTTEADNPEGYEQEMGEHHHHWHRGGERPSREPSLGQTLEILSPSQGLAGYVQGQ